MTNMELILLFKKDSAMTEQEWKSFCKRYGGEHTDITSVIQAIEEIYGKAPSSFKKALKEELKRTLKEDSTEIKPLCTKEQFA